MEVERLVSGRTAVQHRYASITTSFIIALLIGSSLIVLGILFNSTLLAVTAPVLIMLLYIVIGNKDTQLSQSIIGDSYYYMGFVFTLISLGAALFYLSIHDNVDINTIVGSFGAALVTTVIGLVARLITTSFSFKATGQRKRLEDTVENSLATFTVQVETLTDMAIASLTKVHSQTEATLIETLEKYKNINGEITKAFKESMDVGEHLISSSMASLANRIDDIKASPDIISEPISRSLEQIKNTLQSHNESYEELSKCIIITNDRLATQLGNSGAQIQNHVDKMETSLTDAVDRQMVTYEKSLGTTSREIVESLSGISSLKSKTESQLFSDLDGLSLRINKISTQLSEASTPLQESSELLGDSNRKMKINITDFTTLSKDMYKAVSGTQQNINSLDSMNAIIIDLMKAMTRLNEVFGQTISLGKQAGLSMEGAAKATEEGSKNLANDIALVYGALTKQIQQISGVHSE